MPRMRAGWAQIAAEFGSGAYDTVDTKKPT
jgi:hypothetical protein